MKPLTWLACGLALLATLAGVNWYSSRPRPFDGWIKAPVVARRPVAHFDHPTEGTNGVPASATTGKNGPGLSRLSAEERQEVKREFEQKLRPALQHWAMAYANHVPFDANKVTLEEFYARMKTGNFSSYTFMVDGATLTMDDINGVARVRYLNTPATRQLMALPKGVTPDFNMPVTKDEVARMIKADSGEEFSLGEIRMIPTAVSSAMQGGVHAIVGGDTRNAGSALYTLTFGPDKTLDYYLKGAEVLSQLRH
ncbi:MAG TPA: hypothetical protein VHH88_12275 [Verrucomicrobiae bacterium]|nr:hypothetical protein [Verrucomicrobiae bacterium]